MATFPARSTIYEVIFALLYNILQPNFLILQITTRSSACVLGRGAGCGKTTAILFGGFFLMSQSFYIRYNFLIASI